MTFTIIITICALILIAYIFDVVSFKVRTPSAILLLSLGLLFRQVIIYANVEMPDLSVILPVLGTVGLILIVLEGAMELKVDQSKKKVLNKSLFVAVVPMIILALGIAFAFNYSGQGDFKECLSNAIPLVIISSAVAIPSVKKLNAEKKEFVIYESSISDIVGVMFFNFVALNHEINILSIEHFMLQLLIVAVVTFVCTIGIAWLINHLDHEVKATPILVVIVLVYALSKTVHLPALVFVLICGMFMGNVMQLKNNRWVKKMAPEKLSNRVVYLKEVTAEATFLVRILFFIVFGFLIEPSDIIDTATLGWAVAIVFGLLMVRAFFLKLASIPLFPIVFIAPRGLITILLSTFILPEEKIPLVNNSLVIQVVILTALVMMTGLIVSKEKSKPLQSTN